ncbi:hypothetical protein [Tellurirhabdus bombi]|uniref:hypothetical protein n=1 Tax=Tellurirhabdus bombi TaxID=2907205 RepID=UPI001F286CFA|nr:hypothetical protein [Tellurirhabdus bombi]
MGKRLIRIRAANLLEQTARLTGTEVNLVFLDGRTLHGRLTAVQESQLSLRDNIGHRHTVPVAEIDEVVFDEVAPF